MRPVRSRRGGFTLLEIMIALAILAVSLFVVTGVLNQAALVSQYQDQQISAASLARWKMTELELGFEKDGFGDSDKEECGTFEEDLDELDKLNGLERFEFCWTLKKVELPLPMDMMGGGEDGEASGAGSGGQQLAGLGLDPAAAAEQLSKGVRALKVTIKWKTGEIPQELSVTTHLVNMSQVLR